MTIKTFDANRVGGGTFSLEQDAITGEYKLKEVGFVKLPTLKLPEIEQAAYTIPKITPGDTEDDTLTDQGTNTQTGGGGGGDNEQLDYTGTRQLENIQKKATGDTNLTEQAKQFSASDIAYQNYKQVQQNYKNAIDQDAPSPELRQLSLDLDKARANVGMATTGDQRVGAAGDKGFVGPDRTGFGTQEVNEDLIDRGNPTGDSRIVSEEQGLVGNRVPDRIMERTSQFGALAMPQTTTQFGVPDAVRFGQPSLPDKNIIQKASDLVTNSASFKLAGTGLKIASTVATGIGDALLGVTDVDRRRREADSSAAKSLGYTTVGELGGSTDPGRIASVRLANGKIATSSADSVFVGFNRDSAKGNLSQAAANRIETRMTVGQARVDKKYGANSQKAKDFREKTKNFQKEANDFNSKKESQKKEKSQNPNLRSGAGKEGGGDSGCFIKGTLITMLDGSKKPVEKVDLGDNVAIGGKVFAVGRFLNTELYDYKGIKVSGSHMVNEDGTWLRVRDTKHGKSLGDDLNTVYVFGSENRRILIDDILFTDYFEVSEQDQLVNNEEDFFNNWKSYGNTINEHNVNTLNAN